jgi:hypothetical protein
MTQISEADFTKALSIGRPPKQPKSKFLPCSMPASPPSPSTPPTCRTIKTCWPTWNSNPLCPTGPDLKQKLARSRRSENLTAGIWLIFRGLNFSCNADIGQISHFWMGTILLIFHLLIIGSVVCCYIYLAASGADIPEELREALKNIIAYCIGIASGIAISPQRPRS